MATLFDSLTFGDLTVANRLAMAPLTRNRAAAEQVPSELAITYYEQRASAGLIVTEGSQVSAEGQGYLDTPGIHTPAQITAWKRVTDAVHAKGGRIVIQLWHVGRISHVSLLPGGQQPVSSAARIANTKTYLKEGFSAVSEPRALRTDELPGIVEAFRRAARAAMDAGFDGVEIHGANGYLFDQFLRDSLNERTDAYGGSIENRARLLLDAMKAVSNEIGAGRSGLRLSPVTPSNDIGQDSDAQALFNHVAEQLGRLKIAFIHVVEGQTGGPRDVAPFDFTAMRDRFKAGSPSGAWIVNNGYTRQMALDAVASGYADMVAFGKLFISNPDLPRRLKEDAPLNEWNQALFYGGGAPGYIDYPTLDEQAD